MALQSDKLRLLRRIPEIRFEEELRGYSKQQVDRVLENLAPLADEIETLQNRLSEAETRAAAAEARMLENGGRESDLVPHPASMLPATPADFDETLRNTLLLAQRTADETVKRANEDADRITADAESGADQMLAAARAEAAQLEADIQSRRAELLADVDAERQQLLHEIRSTAESRRDAIEQELSQTEGAERAELLSQIEDLQGIRSMLVDDVENLERHLSVRRDAVRSALDEIAAVIDEPDRLRPQPSPEATAPDELPPDVHDSPIAVATPLLDGLIAERHAESEASRDSGDAKNPASSGVDSADSSAEQLVSDLADEGFVVDSSPDVLAAPVFVDAELDDGPATRQVSALDLDPWNESDAEDAGDAVVAPSIGAVARPVARPTWADAVPDAEDLPVDAFVDTSAVSTVGVGTSGAPGSTSSAAAPPPPAVQDPFLDQLRRATSEDAGGDDDDGALDRFLEGDPDGERRSGGGWFGRRR